MEQTKKQTAVEFAIQKLEKFIVKGNQIAVEAILEQAKEMEKEQIKNAWFDSTIQFDNSAEMTYKKDFEQYYNDIFKQD